MSVHIRPGSTALLLALPLALILATSAVLAAAPSWGSPVDVRNASDARLADADFSGHNVAVAWDEPDSPRRVGIRSSVDNGAGFGPISWFGRARQPSVDICGASELNAVMARRVGPGNWAIEHDVGSIDGVGFLSTPVAPSDGIQRNPDVACAGGRVFVTWFEDAGSGRRLYAAHAPRTGGKFSAPISLGFDDETFFFRSLAVAGADNTAYAVFQRSDGDLRIKRWSVGGGPDFAVTGHSAQIIGPGTSNRPAYDAVIDADGSRVAVAWATCDAVYARVSNDHGRTWGPIRTLIEHAACDGDFIATQRSIVVDDNRIAVSYLASGIVGDGEVGLIRTWNDFATFQDETIADRAHAEHLIGYVRVAGNPRLAAAFQPNDSRIRFRRQL